MSSSSSSSSLTSSSASASTTAADETKKKEEDDVACNVETARLSSQEIEAVEKQCRKQTHLGSDDSLSDLVRADESAMAALRITFQQLTDFFDKVKFHFKHGAVVHEFTREEQLLFAEAPCLKNKLGGEGWCCWGMQKATALFGCLDVFRISWGGAEMCPFQRTTDTRYHGYEYGSYDWIFVNKTKQVLHIGDLLFHQISQHHFFQSPSSAYRVDPAALVGFFDLKPDADYSTDKETYFSWSTTSSSNYIPKGWHTHLGAAFSSFKVATRGDCVFGYTDDAAFIVARSAKNLPKTIDGHEYRYFLVGMNGDFTLFKKRKDQRVTRAELAKFSSASTVVS